ncbi:MAG: LytTR family transcriptional regulator [Cyclobacteriaceae bacterium]|nr:LytTR family transcriptional regulator [Cyclobacteriaceae bacterium]
MRWWYSPYPFYFNDERKNMVLTVGIGLFVMFFLRVYKDERNEVLFGCVTIATLGANIVLLPRLLPTLFDFTSWTVGKYIVLTGWHVLSIALVSSWINIAFVHPELTPAANVARAFVNVATTGVITIALVSLLLRNYQLRENLSDALAAKRELEKIHSLKAQKEQPAEVSLAEKQLITLHTETTETFRFYLPDLLYVEADDNYSTVVWKNGTGVQRKLLRVNLKSIESQLNNAFTIRCHRSYMVNINAITNVVGNTNGYKLSIADLDVMIPVSRPKGKEIMERIQQLRSMMEIA